VVFVQLNPPETVIMNFWSDLQDLLGFAEPRLQYFHQNDPWQALKNIVRKARASLREIMVDAVSRYPWTKARDLSGSDALFAAIEEYSRSMDGGAAS